MKRLIAIFSIIALAAVAAVAQTMSVAGFEERKMDMNCLLYKSDAADEQANVDNGYTRLNNTKRTYHNRGVQLRRRVNYFKKTLK